MQLVCICLLLTQKTNPSTNKQVLDKIYAKLYVNPRTVISLWTTAVHRTVLTIFPLILQTDIIAHMLSITGQRETLSIKLSNCIAFEILSTVNNQKMPEETPKGYVTTATNNNHRDLLTASCRLHRLVISDSQESRKPQRNSFLRVDLGRQNHCRHALSIPVNKNLFIQLTGKYT